MPVVFSPGEAETRPLDPEAIVYTTAQKVADLLGIGPSEAVLVANDSTSTPNTVYVTGADFRDHGFTVGDSVLIYSDNDPLGFTIIVDTITTGSSGVGLTFSEAWGVTDHTNYTATLNTYVQNEASFTNGKTRGVKRSHVETRIKEAQDKIDNVAHNAWRPSIVIAEYINFDTYKPYRRRYYTDYVGTSPLLFRNIQQILRLELWQGDDYREIAGAEVRLKVIDHAKLDGKTLYFSPGKGYAALPVGTGSDEWRNDFDNVTTAQNLADLINKEDRVSKTTIDFKDHAGANYTLEGSTSNLALNNEFLATANADYGTTKLKVTSMRHNKSGETATIACDDLTNLQISQTEVKTDTGTLVLSGVPGGPLNKITVTSTEGYAPAGLLMYVNGDETSVVYYNSKTDTTFNDLLKLKDPTLHFYDNGAVSISQYVLKLDLQGGSASGDSARRRDWWIDNEMGIIYFNNSYPYFEWNAIKVSYIYGERYLEQAIQEATTKMVAAELLMADDRSVLIPEGTQNVDLASKIQLWKNEAEKILSRYKEVVYFA
jgi:hypothetical protein